MTGNLGRKKRQKRATGCINPERFALLALFANYKQLLTDKAIAKSKQ